jgi:TfoX/Sxy family transcriptional regulator of competence genes
MIGIKRTGPDSKTFSMGSDKNQLEFALDQMDRAGEITVRSMFGEYGIYCDGKIVALFCDNKLFVKPTQSGRAFIRDPVESSPYPGAKPYFLIEDKIEDRDWLAELIRVTARELPEPRKKSGGKSPKAHSAARRAGIRRR